jgi:hypothetical protein
MLCVIVAIAASAPAAQSKTLKKYKEDFSFFFSSLAYFNLWVNQPFISSGINAQKIFIYNG